MIAELELSPPSPNLHFRVGQDGVAWDKLARDGREAHPVYEVLKRRIAALSRSQSAPISPWSLGVHIRSPPSLHSAPSHLVGQSHKGLRLMVGTLRT